MVQKRPKRGFNLGAPMNNCLLTKSMNTLEVSSLLLRLLTLDKVAFLNKGSLCPLCSNEPESNAHLFFSCRKSLQVWAHIRDLAPFRRRFTSLQRITDSLIRGRSTSGVQGKLRCLTIAITVYCIWLFRNKLIFEDYQFSAIEVISKIKFLMYRQAHMLHLF
ncbi:hypothetical protein HKD37_14G041108 [Glycine soja]